MSRTLFQGWVYATVGFAPAQPWNLSKVRNVSGHSPARGGGQFNERGPSSSFFWCGLAGPPCVSAVQDIPLRQHACRNPCRGPSVVRRMTGMASRTGPPLLHLPPDSQGRSQPQADSEAPRQLCVWETVMSSLCKRHFMNSMIV